jgi:type IV secretion system protein VirB5
VIPTHERLALERSCVMTLRPLRFLLLCVALSAGVPAARAQFAVIDVASLTQLISQLQTLEQELATARAQLGQAQAQYQSMTGTRGMQSVLAGTPRNYLPTDWTALESTLAGSGAGYPALSAALHGAVSADAILTPAQLAQLSPGARAQLQAGRQSTALLQALSHQALANASNRFGSLQQLIDAIGGAADQKAVLDLQARIAAENGMLENEHTKLDDLYQGALAEQWVNGQRLRELAVAGHGQFASRFQPHP